MGFFTSLDLWGKCCAVLTFCVAVCFILLTIPYFISIASHVNESDSAGEAVSAVLIILWVISILILFCIATCGIWGSCKQQERCLCIFFIVNVVNWLFTIIQMIIFYVAYERCGTDDPLVSEGSPFASMCHGTNDLLVWIQSILLAGVNALGAFVSCSLRYKIMLKQGSKKKGMGEYFG